ncbi:DMT family transporter [Hasllibacter sp. MH4015]|uniref:DMT family transporter n=1 Tax=Hasllibacter sp. MH4015 TaxID=2854029 RepID=UPI001CD5FA8A|nr:DMT family transporter [Hasllibacter sp. MH4015]
MTRTRWLPLILLIGMGALWGITQPLSKIAVADGYRDIGIIFWQFAIGSVLLGALNLVRGRGLPLGPAQLRFYLMIALIGTILPNWASFTAAVHLPSGILSIVLATVPMMAFPIAMALGMDRFSTLRFVGLLLGLGAIVMIAAPDSSLPDPSLAIWLPVALIAPFFYAVEGNVVAKWGTAGLDAVQVLLGASILGAILALPLALVTGEFIAPPAIWGPADWAIVGIALAHTSAYATYVWLVGQTGAVFVSQVGYLVTGFGVVWAKLVLGESYSGWIWGALALMLIGVALVQPRKGANQGA